MKPTMADQNWESVLAADSPSSPSRRNMLKTVGLGALGAALAYSGLSELGAPTGRADAQPSSVPGTMTYRTHPKNGDKISLLGYGCMRLPLVSGTTNNSEIDEAAAIALIDHAIESGVNFFDTAWMYHQGMSAVVMGKALKRHPRASHFMSNKMPTGLNPTLDEAKSMFVQQLERCETAYFDYYLLHAVMSTASYRAVYEEGGVLDYLLAEKAAGRIRNLGFSFHGDQACLEYLLSRDVDWDIALVQLNYHDLLGEYRPPAWLSSSLDSPLATPQWILGKMTETDIPLMVMEPLLGGRLARLNRKAVDVLQDEIPDASAASWAFRYVASIPNVLTVLSGMTYMEHLQDNVKTFSPLHPLNEVELAVLKRALGYFMNPDIIPCTTCGYCMPCPYGVDIPTTFLHYNNCLDNETIPSGARSAEYERARRAYLVGYDRAVSELRQAQRCTECGVCKKECPQQIDIASEIARLGTFAERLRNEG